MSRPKPVQINQFMVRGGQANTWKSEKCVEINIKDLDIPTFIEGMAKGWLQKSYEGKYYWLLREHKPRHRRGKLIRYQYIGRPKRRPLVTHE